MKKSRYLSILSLALAFTSIPINAGLLSSLSKLLLVGSTFFHSTESFHTRAGGSDEESSAGIVLDGSDNLYVTGQTKSFGSGNNEGLLFKYDNLGDLQVAKTYGKFLDEVFKGISMGSNEVAMVGWTKNFGAFKKDGYFVITNLLGNLDWAGLIGSTEDDLFEDVATSSTGYVTVGWTKSYSSVKKDGFIVSLDNSGSNPSISWAKTIGGSNHDVFKSVAVNPTNGMITAVGNTRSYGSTESLFAAQLSSAGVVQWVVQIGGDEEDPEGHYSEVGNAVTVDANGNSYIAGYAFKNDFEGIEDYAMVIKLDSSGTSEWIQLFGEMGRIEKLYAIAHDGSDAICVGGYTDGYNAEGYGMFVAKLSASTGDMSWMTLLDGTGNEKITGVQFDSNQDVIVSGWSDSTGAGGKDVIIANIDGSDGSSDCGVLLTFDDFEDPSWMVETDITNDITISTPSVSLDTITNDVTTSTSTSSVIEGDVC